MRIQPQQATAAQLASLAATSAQRAQQSIPLDEGSALRELAKISSHFVDKVKISSNVDDELRGVVGRSQTRQSIVAEAHVASDGLTTIDSLLTKAQESYQAGTFNADDLKTLRSDLDRAAQSVSFGGHQLLSGTASIGLSQDAHTELPEISSASLGFDTVNTGNLGDTISTARRTVRENLVSANNVADNVASRIENAFRGTDVSREVSQLASALQSDPQGALQAHAGFDFERVRALLA